MILVVLLLVSLIILMLKTPLTANAAVTKRVFSNSSLNQFITQTLRDQNRNYHTLKDIQEYCWKRKVYICKKCKFFKYILFRHCKKSENRTIFKLRLKILKIQLLSYFKYPPKYFIVNIKTKIKLILQKSLLLNKLFKF